jgi:heme-degrading monooxygenase HmoA
MSHRQIRPRRRAHRQPLAIAALAALASHWGCSDEASPGKDQAAACRADALEADLEAAPLAGPGVDHATGKLRPPGPGEHYVVSSTYGAPKQDPAALERWGQLMEAIQAQLEVQPGLLALELASSSACASGRTLAVWSSEEAMYEFVTSPAHAAAMVAADEVVQPGFRVTHWEEISAERISFAEGARRLGQERE